MHYKLEKILFDFFTVSNAIEGIYDEQEARAQVELFYNTTEMPLEQLMYLFHSKMNHLNDYCVAGRLRTYTVYVWGRECARHETIAEALQELFKRVPTTYLEIRQWHIDFEHLHPFWDWNWRVWRMLMLRQLLDAKIAIPNIFRNMKNFQENRQRYYRWF